MSKLKTWLSPPVRGFGDSIPAFMLIPIPRPRRPAAEPAAPAEAATETAGEAACSLPAR